MNKFVSLVSHEGELFALTEDGKIFRIYKDISGLLTVTLILEISNG